MNQTKLFCFLLIFGLFLLTGCTDTIEKIPSHKILPGDPFESTIVESQFFEVDAKAGGALQGTAGTFVVIPDGALLDGQGNVFEGRAKIELAEALTFSDMILSNLTTTSAGEPLETDGMIYFAATANGEPLTINPDKPVYIEIPTTEKKPGMQAYQGVRDSSGNMDWRNPKDLEDYLIPVDLLSLDFLPEGFEEEIELNLPFLGHTELTREFRDSLYFSFSVSQPGDLLKGLKNVELNEPYYNPQKEVVNGKYTEESFNSGHEERHGDVHTADSAGPAICGIDPAIINVLYSPPFQNSLISTREFETRLRVLHKICRDDLVKLYLEHLDKNLWEIDQIVAKELNGDIYETEFDRFSNEKLTNIEDAGEYVQTLRKFFEARLKEVKHNLENARKEMMSDLRKENEEVEGKVKAYRSILIQREKNRMETYGFTWTANGWINIDTGTVPKSWGPQSLEIVVEETDKFSAVYAYAVFTKIKSIYRLNALENGRFFVGNEAERNMLMPKAESIVLAIGYQDDQTSFAQKKYKPGQDTEVSLTLAGISPAALKSALDALGEFDKANQIEVDLEYMKAFREEKKRQQKLQDVGFVLQRLRRKAFPCCGGESEAALEG